MQIANFCFIGAGDGLTVSRSRKKNELIASFIFWSSLTEWNVLSDFAKVTYTSQFRHLLAYDNKEAVWTEQTSFRRSDWIKKIKAKINRF